MEFEWNSDKAALNFEKHSVSFQEGVTVFNDPLSVTFLDLDHSLGESRYIIIGVSSLGKFLVIAHTDRGKKIRMISDRKATHKEKRFYEEGR